MHADRTNRTALILFGLLVFAAGGAGMTASVGGFGQAVTHRTLFDNFVSAYIGHHGWIWYAAAGVCLIIALAALLWIATLLVSTDRADDLPIPVASHEGTTILLPAALTGALTREIGDYHGVEAVRGRIIGDADDPEIVLAVTASPTADLHALHQRIETEALAHAREALGKADLAIQLDLAVTRLRLRVSRLRNALIAARPLRRSGVTVTYTLQLETGGARRWAHRAQTRWKYSGTCGAVRRRPTSISATTARRRPARRWPTRASASTTSRGPTKPTAAPPGGPGWSARASSARPAACAI
jgi:hypothetical protein